jgi:hypothetical protein
MEETRKEIEVDEINIILKIPKESVRLVVSATVLDNDGKTMKLEKTLSVSDIMAARKDFLDYVEEGDDYDVRYVLTDKGLEYLKELDGLPEDEGGDSDESE